MNLVPYTRLGADGAPAEGAVVVTSAGGKVVVDAEGFYRLEVQLPPEAESVQVTAVGRGGGQLLAGRSTGVFTASGYAWVGTLSLVQGGSCSPSWLPTLGEHPGTNNLVLALTVYDDGGGPALYAGGSFTTAGAVTASGIARWDGTSWSALGSGMDGYVSALTVYDGGGGEALYAGGGFTTAGGVAANRVARWNGSSWSALGSGMDGTVSALTVYDDGGGPGLYAGGAPSGAARVRSRPNRRASLLCRNRRRAGRSGGCTEPGSSPNSTANREGGMGRLGAVLLGDEPGSVHPPTPTSSGRRRRRRRSGGSRGPGSGR